MYFSATQVNGAFTAFAAARPLSHLAAATLLGTSIYAVHEGAASILPAGLVLATTAAMVGMEWLQWTGLGRISKLDDAGEHARAAVLKLQCFGIACLQVVLYTLAVVAFAKAGGADWSQGWALTGAIAIAALYAGLNFVAKWTSCDPVAARTSGGPTGGQRVHDVLFSEPVRGLPALAAPEGENVVAFDVERAIRHKSEQERSLLGDIKAACSAEGDAARRLQLATKRLQTRHRRAAQRAAICA